MRRKPRLRRGDRCGLPALSARTVGRNGSARRTHGGLGGRQQVATLARDARHTARHARDAKRRECQLHRTVAHVRLPATKSEQDRVVDELGCADLSAQRCTIERKARDPVPRRPRRPDRARTARRLDRPSSDGGSAGYYTKARHTPVVQAWKAALWPITRISRRPNSNTGCTTQARTATLPPPA